MLSRTLPGRIPNQERLNSLCPVCNTVSFTPIQLTPEHHQHSQPLRRLWPRNTRIQLTLEHHQHDQLPYRLWHQGMRPLRNNHHERST